MMPIEDVIKRVSVAAVTGTFTKDLAREVLEHLKGRRRSPREQRAERNAVLCRAAAQLPGTSHAKAERLALEVTTLAERREAPFGEAGGARALARQALEIDPKTPRSWRQMLRIIDGV